MKKFIFPFFLLLFISLLSFILFIRPQPVVFNTVTAAGKFSIAIPAYLSKTQGIDSAAVLQYKNEKEQLFLLVYEKTDTLNLPLETVFKKISADFISNMGRGNLIKYYPMQLNSYPAVVGNIRGIIHETEVYYKIAIIRSENSFYEILIGTTEDKEFSYEEDLDKIVRGFKCMP